MHAALVARNPADTLESKKIATVADMNRLAFGFCFGLLLAGCAPRGTLGYSEVIAGATMQVVHVVTNRVPADQSLPDLFDQDFGEARDDTLRFARLTVSVPATHELGQIEWPHREETLNPRRHFAVVKAEPVSGAAQFTRTLADAEGDEVLLFVHGYNVNNAEAVYRLAQVVHDYDLSMPAVLYSWPSAGMAGGYVYDRDSVIFSRDGLEALLGSLSRAGLRVQIVAHSMGSQLVMETLRQMSIGGNRAPLARIASVTLIAPDIDEDVFLKQAERIRPFPEPFTLLVSHRDRALNVAAWLTGRPTRLGSIRDASRLEGLPVRIVDLTDVEGGDRIGHATAFTAPTAIEQLKKAIERLF
jgi:esterase/lipase superfamily enzyme